MAFELTSVKIPSATSGWSLDAWNFLPSSTETSNRSTPHPVIIMAHGLSAHKQLGLEEYAFRYVAEGYACVIFDYRRWGASDGIQRHVLKVSEQLEDYRTVIQWAKGSPEFDEERIIVWGTSFSGGHVIQLASENHDIAAALCQCPYAGSARNKPGLASAVPVCFNLFKLVAYAVADVLKQSLRLSPLYLAATSEPGKGGILSTPGASDGYYSLAKDPSLFQNQINASCIFEIRRYNPHFSASSILCPLLLVVPEKDNICSMDGALEVTKSAKRSEVVRVEGDHFDVYPGHIGFDKTIQAQLNFLRKHVPVREDTTSVINTKGALVL